MSSKTESFKKGDRVRARWSGSNVFYDAKIMDVLKRTIKVQYDDGSISSVKMADVKKLLKSEKDSSPKTSKSKSRSRSRSAGRKIGRPRSRSQSPARREKKAPKKEEKKPPSKPEKKKPEESPNSNSISKDEIDGVKIALTREKIGLLKNDSAESLTSSILTSNSYSKKMSISVERYDENSGRLRSSRTSTLRSSEPKQILDLKQQTSDKHNALLDKEKYSDEEEDVEVIKTSKAMKISWQALYFLCTLLRIVVVPTILLFFIFSCTRKQCTILEVPQFYSRWKDLGNSIKFPFASVVAFHILQSVLSLVPIGQKVAGFPDANKSTREYRVNGIYCLICTVLTFSISSYFGVYMNWGFDKFKSIALSSLMYCVLCSLILYLTSMIKGNGTVESKVPLLGKFYNGVYVNPLLYGKVDIKTGFIRAGLIGSVLLNLSILLKFFLMKGHLPVPLALTAGMQMFFVLDLVVREEKMLSTATYTSDSVGYAFIMTTGFLIPMGLALQTVYLFINETKAALVPHYCSAAMLVFFFCGYYIYMTSGNLKHNFRRNPFSPSLSDIASIPTSKKKRLITSGLWGVVRHPNYLGLLIMAIAWTLPCGFSHVVPFGPLIMLFFALVIRIFRVEADCKEKYGPSWSNYSEKVRSRLVPYIF